MKRTFKKIIAILLVLATLMGTMVAGVHATEEETQSVETKTPDNTNWEFDASGGVLTVYGTGESYNLVNASDYPWYQHKNETNKIVIANGITSVGDNAFYGFSASSVEIAETVEYIGNNAFGGCASLSDISVPESFTGFGENAFKGTAHYSDSANWTDGEYYIGSTLVEVSTGMTAYAVKDGTVAVADFAIDSVSAENVYIPASVEYIGSRAFANASALKTITVDENNPNYSSDKNGALYNKDKTKLIYVPSNAEGMQETFSATFTVGGEVFGDVIYGKEGMEINPPEAIPVKSGYKFLGWAVEGDTDIVTFPVTMSDENITFVAVFKEYLGEDDTLTIETKFYKQDSVTGEWVYTEYVEPGDRVKARVFINTTYYAVCGNVILFYDNRFFEDDLVESTQTNLKVNESASFVTSYETHLYMKHLSESGIISRMLSEGYISEEFAQTHNAYTVIFDLGNTTKLSSEEWLFEFDLRVREDATGEGFFGATEDTVMNYDRCFAYTDIPMIPEGRDVIDSTSLSNLYVNIETICNTVSQKTVNYTATFNPANGEEAIIFTQPYYSLVTAPAAPIKENSNFIGWSNGTTTIQPGETFNLVGNVTFTAQYEETKFELIYYYTGDMPTESVPLPSASQITEGAIISAPVVKVPAGYTLLWSVTGATMNADGSYTAGANDVVFVGAWEAIQYKYRYYLDDEKTLLFTTMTYTYGDIPDDVDLPTDEQLTANGFKDYHAEGWDIDTPATVTDNVDFCLIKSKNNYNLSFYVDGEKYHSISVPFGYEIKDEDIPVPPAKEGYTFIGWLDENGNTIPESMPACNIEFRAMYAASMETMYTVETYTMGLDGSYGAPDVEIRTGAADTIVTVDANPEEGFYVAEDSVLSATVSPDGTTTFIIKYARNKYTVKYVVDGDYLIYEEECYHGAEISDLFGASYIWKHSDGSDVIFPLIATDNLTLYGEIPASAEPVWEINGDITVTEFEDYTVLSGFGGVPTEQQIAESFACNDYAYVSVTANENGLYSSGAKAEIYGTESGELLATYYIAVKGDVNGDGAVNPDDGYIVDSEIYAYTNWSNETSSEFNPWKTVAADYDSSKIITSADFKGFGFVWYSVEVFNMNMKGEYGYSDYENYIAMNGDSVTVKTSPAEGYSVDEEISVLNGTVSESGSTNFVVYYKRNYYTLTTVVDGVETSTDILFGSVIPAVETPVKEGYEFAGWSEAIPVKMPAKDITVTAIWNILNYEIVWIVDGIEISKEYYNYGETIIFPEEPVREGYIFYGWVIEETFESVPEMMPAHHLTAVATFEACMCSIEWRIGDEIILDYYHYGETIVPPEVPQKDGYIFVGWDNPVPEYMTESFITFTAVFEKVQEVMLVAAQGSTTVIDRSIYTNNGPLWYVHGLETRLTENTLLSDYIAVEGDGYVEIVSSSSRYIGTGSVINVYNNSGELAESFYVIIHGDLNGDGSVNSADISMIEYEIAGVTSWSYSSSDSYIPYIWFVADVNLDGLLDLQDAEALGSVVNGEADFDQITGEVISTVSTFSLRSFFGLTREVKEEVLFIVPETVTEIGDYAFMNSRVTKVKIPASVTDISDTAFAEASALEYIDVNDENGSYTDINGILFTKDETKIVVYPKALTDTSYTLPLGTKEIGGYAFKGSALERIYLPSSLVSIGDYAFFGCDSLTYADIENNVTNIGKFAFYGCPLETADIPEKLETLGDYAFFGSRLDKIDISETVSKIGILAFGGNLLLEKITVDENNTAYTSDDNGVLFTKDTAELIQYPAAISQSEYTIPEEVSVIADSAFAQSSNLGEIIFSEGLISIGDNAFNGCSSVRNIIVPESVEYIGDNAFSSCINVLRMKLDAKFIDSADFTEMNSLMDLQLTGDTSNVIIPAKLINFIAIGSYTDIQLSWSISNEINSSSYRIFRKSENENDYSLLAAITSRETQSYKDSSAAEDMSYSYVIVSVDKTTGIISPISKEAVAARREDTVAPTVTKITPETFTYISKTKTISVSATDDFMMSKVVLSYKPSDAEEWIVIGEDSVSPYSFAFDTTTIADGEIDVRAVAYDASGNESSPMVVYYSVDNTPPEKVTGLNAKVIRATAITLEWNDIKARDKACFVIQKKTSDSYETLSQYVTDLGYNVLGLEPETEYTFRVAAKDSQGNMGEYSDDFTVSTTADVTAPVITKIGPGKQRFNSSFVFTATAVDDDFAVKKIEVQTSVNRTDWNTVYSEEYSDYLSEKTISCGIDAAEYEDGSIFIRAVATDYAGNVSDTSDSAPLVENIIDRVAPEAPSGIKATSMDGYVLIEWSQGSESDLDKYTLYRATEENGTYSKIYGPAAALNHYDKTVDRDTVYYYKVAVSDTAGNISDYSAIVSAKSLEDMENPVINSISPADGSFISEKTNKVSVLASDNNMLSEIVIEYKKGLLGSYDVLQSFADIGDYYKVVKATLPVSELEDGDTVYVRAYCTDITGLESGYSDAVKLTVDKTAPSTENLKAEHKNGVCTVTWDDCGEEDLAGFNVYRSVNGGSYTMIGSRAVSDTGSYSFDDAVTEGTYIYRIDTCDAYGNTESFFTENIIVEKIINLVAVITSKTTLEESVEYTFSSEASEADEEIISYYWDFGDGTFSNEKNPIKTYKAINTYTVTLIIADIKGNTSETSKTITVIERQIKGIAEVFVKDDSGNPVSGALVHLDIKQNNQNPKGTNRNGYVSFEAIAGAHVFSVYKDGYLPASANVIVSANNTSTVELTIVKQELITGEFEVHEMTFDEIVEAGIDTSNPANQQIYKVTVTLIYGKEKLPVTYIRNDREIISYEIEDKNGTADGTENEPNSGTGGPISKEISGIHYVPNKDNKEIIAVIQIPVTASYLKQFYSANLHIINNAAPGYEIVNCSATINVPSGLSVVQSTPISKVINGGSSSTANWILRGDKEGTYNLSASFSGTLNDFNVPVKATFKAKNPVVVYGPETVKLRMEVNSEIKYGTLYFNVGLVNQRSVNVNCPQIDIIQFVKNVTESVKNKEEVIDGKNEDCELEHIRIDMGGNTSKSFTPGSQSEELKEIMKTLPPGYGLFYEYVVHGLVEHDTVGYFNEAAIECAEEYYGAIEVVSIDMDKFGNDNYDAIYSNITENQYAIIVNDSKGDPVPGAKVLFDDQKEYTDEKGAAIFNSVNKKTAVIDVSAKGYRNYSNINMDRTLNEKRYEVITLYGKDESEHHLKYAHYLSGLKKIDILNGVKRVNGKPEHEFTFSIRCEAIVTDNVKEYQLWQQGKFIAVSKDGKFERLKTDMFVVGSGVGVLVVSDNDEVTQTVINLEIVDETKYQSTMIQLNHNKVEFSLGDIGFPLFDNSTLKFDILSDKLPLDFLVEEDHVYVTINAKLNDPKKTPKEKFEEIRSKIKSPKDILNRFKTGEWDDMIQKSTDGVLPFVDNLDVNFISYGEGKITDGKVTRLTLNAFICIDFAMSKNWHWLCPVSATPPIIVPLQVELEFEAKLSAGPKINFIINPNSVDVDLDWKFVINPAIAAAGGVGAGDYFSLHFIKLKVEGYIKALLGDEISRAIEELWFIGSISTKVEVAGIEYEKKWARKKYYIYPQQTKASKSESPMNSMFDIDNYTLEDTNYLSKRSSDDTNTFNRSASKENIYVPLINNTYSAAAPTTIVSDNGVIMAYVDGYSSGSGSAKTVAMFSTYDYSTNSWSSPVPLDNNTYSDYMVKLFNVDGEVYAVYQQRRTAKDIGNMSVNELLSTVELVVSRYDSSTGTFIHEYTVNPLDNTYYSMYSLDGTKENVRLAYVASSSEDPFGTKGNNKIISAEKKNGKWISEIVVENEKSIKSVSVYEVNGEPVIVYIRDADNNISTRNDAEVIAINGVSTKLYEGTADSLKTRNHPLTGNEILSWETDDNIAYTSDCVNVKNIFNDGEQFTSSGNDYFFTSGRIYFVSGSDMDTDVYMSSYDAKTETWNNPVQITKDNGYVNNLSVVKYNGRIISTALNVDVSITDESFDTCSALSWCVLSDTQNAKIDFVLFDSKDFVPETTAPLTVSVTNTGTEEISSIDFAFNGKTFTLENISIMPGEAKACSITIDVPQEIPTDKQTIEIASVNKQMLSDSGEPHEFIMAYPDICTESEVVRKSDNVQFIVNLTNNGNIPTDGTLSVYWDDEANIIKTIPVDTINPGESSLIRVEINPEMFNGDNSATVVARFDSSNEEFYIHDNETSEFISYAVYGQVTGVSLNKSELTLLQSEEATLEYAIELIENADDFTVNKYVAWQSSDPEVVSVTNEGIITAKSVGQAEITVTTYDGDHTAICSVTVSPKTYKLTWIVDGVETTENLEEGAAITLPQPPVKAGYEFAGWCPEVPETMPASDMQFTAIFEEACPVLSVEATSENIKNCEYTDINVKTLDSVTRLKFITTDEKGKNTVLVYHETNSAVLITDNGDGTKTWSISMMFVNNGKGVIAQTYSVWYYKSDSVFYDQSDKSFTVNIIGEEDEVQTYEPYSVISVSAPETAKKSKFVSVTVTTTDDVTKVRFKDMSTGSTRTYLKTTTNVTCTDNGDGTLTWTIKYKFTVAGEQNLGVQCRGSKWSNITEKETVGIVIE